MTELTKNLPNGRFLIFFLYQQTQPLHYPSLEAGKDFHFDLLKYAGNSKMIPIIFNSEKLNRNSARLLVECIYPPGSRNYCGYMTGLG